MKTVKDLKKLLENCDDDDYLVLLLDTPSRYEILDISNSSVKQTGNCKELTINFQSRKR